MKRLYILIVSILALALVGCSSSNINSGVSSKKNDDSSKISALVSRRSKINGNSKIEINNEEPKIEINNEEPKIESNNEEPKIEINNEEPKIEINNEEPKIEINNEEPKIEINNEEPKIELNNEESEIEINNEEPKIEPNNEEPKIEPNNGDFNMPEDDESDYNFDTPEYGENDYASDTNYLYTGDDGTEPDKSNFGYLEHDGKLSYYRIGKVIIPYSDVKGGGPRKVFLRNKDGQNYGTHITYNQNGQIARQVDYVPVEGKINSERHGIQKRYHKNGNIESVKEYVFGQENGRSEHYYEDGDLKKIEEFDHGKRHGKIVHFNGNGKIIYEENYRNGKIHGPAIDHQNGGKTFYLDNYIVEEEAYNNYVKEKNYKVEPYTGTVKYKGEKTETFPKNDSYDDIGETQFEPIYKDGKVIRVNTFVDGKIDRVTNYKDEKLHGEDVLYFKNGNVQYKANYKNGKKDGQEVLYVDGKALYIKNYKDGKLHGEYRKNDPRYHRHSYRITNYKDGKKHGESANYKHNKVRRKIFYDNGVIIRAERYDNFRKLSHVYNFKNGELFSATSYDYDGNVIETVYYDATGFDEEDCTPITSSTGKSSEKSKMEKEVLELRKQVDKNTARIEEVSKENKQGIALSTAMAQINPLGNNEGKFSAGVGIGHFKGETGLAFGLGYGISEGVSVSSKGAFTVGDFKTFSIGAGLNIQF